MASLIQSRNRCESLPSLDEGDASAEVPMVPSPKNSSRLNPFLLMEAVSSVALSHEADYQCRTCRAAAGDEQAMAEILLAAIEAGDE